MRVSAFLSIVLILLLWSCIDRFFYDIDLPQGVPITVYGHITNQPGPYKVNINTSFDINSKENIKTPVSVKHVNLMDERGTNEELNEVAAGVYQTSTTGIRGRIGGVYKLRIEFHDGKIYESIPDTLLAPGKIDSLYHEFYTRVDASGTTRYGFDLMINSSSNSKNTRNMWNFTGTFKALTHPEWGNTARSQCYPLPGIVCNFLPPCTGLRNTSPPSQPPLYETVAPCTCCICWYQIFSNIPLLSDEIYSEGTYKAIKVYDIPLNEWIFQNKIHALVTQATLTVQSFQYFNSIKDQKESVGSLSQPTVGRIPNTFIQIEGASAPINGIFYSSGTDSRSIYVTPFDVRNTVPIPAVGYTGGLGTISCLELFPNSTTVQPDFWID
jgi:hypothetical protein